MPMVRVDGIDLYYETAGDGAALLLIHALGSSCRDRERQIPAFSAHYKVIAIELRGHGRSGKPRAPIAKPCVRSQPAGLSKSIWQASAARR